MEKRNTGTKKSMGGGGGGGGGTTKKPRSTRMSTRCREVPKGEDDEEISNVFTVELDTLHCEICFLPFESRVYTCKNGHAACAKCCVSVRRECSFCREPIGDSRCRAMEKILAGMTGPCKFSKNGCPETVRFTEMRSHEEKCRYAPYGCPFHGCAFRGLHLYGHILERHATGASTMDLLGHVEVTLDKGEPLRALLHRDGERVFLLLNGGDVLTGRSLSLVRVYPHPAPEKPVDKCNMMVIGDDKPGSMAVCGIGTVQFVRRLQGFQPKGFLFVPDALFDDTGSFTVHVHFR